MRVPGAGSSMLCPWVTGTWPRRTAMTALAGVWEPTGPPVTTAAWGFKTVNPNDASCRSETLTRTSNLPGLGSQGTFSKGLAPAGARGVDGQGRLSFVQTTSPGAGKPRSTFTWYVRGSPGTGSSMSCPSVTGTWPRCTVITTLAGTWEQPGPNTATTATTDPTSFSRFVHGPGTDRTS